MNPNDDCGHEDSGWECVARIAYAAGQAVEHERAGRRVVLTERLVIGAAILLLLYWLL